MKVSYKNAERLVRTELNFIQNQSARESMEAAGLSEYEFIAVLDHRTSQRCQALDGTIHLLEEYDVGTNAPPMHPRCRSTISAVIEGGKRTAKTGKNIKVPADWNYEKWRASVESGKIIELHRRITKPLTYKPVSEEKYNKLIIPLKKMGVTIMRGDEDVEKHLDFVGARASTLGTEAVLFRKDVLISEILEETYHIKQNRAGLNDDKDSTLRTILNEIDAKEYLLRVAQQYAIPREEIEETKIQLEEYRKALEDYQKERR